MFSPSSRWPTSKLQVTFDAARARSALFTGPSSKQVFDAAVVELVTDSILQHSSLGFVVLQPTWAENLDHVTVIAGGLVWLISNWLLFDLTSADSVASRAHRISVQLVQLSLAGN